MAAILKTSDQFVYKIQFAFFKLSIYHLFQKSFLTVHCHFKTNSSSSVKPMEANLEKVAILQASEHMMTSSNGNLFSATGHLCVEFTGHRWSQYIEDILLQHSAVHHSHIIKQIKDSMLQRGSRRQGIRWLAHDVHNIFQKFPGGLYETCFRILAQ